jgi:DNA invertase Pin-like site-specific DNA recombinase
MKCFAYLRVSSIGQTTGDGYDRQILACEQYAAKNGLEIAEVFREAITGKSDLDARPALGELFVALEENGIKTVIVEKLDRVARDLMIQEAIVADMQRRGYTLISTAEPDLCSTDPSRVLIRQIFGAISQWEKSVIVLKLQGARQRKRAADPAYRDGRKAYGEKPGEREILDRMTLMRDGGAIFQTIADTLNAEGVTTRMGAKWHAPTVQKILSR